MKLRLSATHSSIVEIQNRLAAAGMLEPQSTLPAMTDETTQPSDFDELYRRYFHECCRWMRAMGVSESDLEDLAQEVFIVVERKLEAPLVNPAGWIYRIAWRTVSDHRRRNWWRVLFSRRPDGALPETVDPAGAPDAALERKQKVRLLARVLSKMSEIRRVTFVLFEVEGYSGERIAALQQVPLKTVWTRLHHARKSFIELSEREQRLEDKRARGEVR